MDFAALTGRETVVELYCGVGTISLTLAERAGRVIGVEAVPQAAGDGLFLLFLEKGGGSL